MTAAPSIDPAACLHEQLAQASPDLIRELLSTFIDALLSAEADAVCGAGWVRCPTSGSGDDPANPPVVTVGAPTW